MRTSESTPGWTLARTPDDVPTPVAVAAADFCRRAGRPATAEDIRLALARLEASDDDRVLEIAREEPPGRPLGPEALVDLVLGLDPEEATARESQGYYLAMARAPRGQSKAPGKKRSAAVPSADALEEEAGPSGLEAEKQELLAAFDRFRGDSTKVAASLHLSAADLEARIRKLSLVRRVASIQRDLSKGPVPPRVRAGPPPPHQRPQLTPPAQLPKRGAGRPPMGRMAQGKAERRKIGELSGPSGRQELLDLIRLHPSNLSAVVRRMNLTFSLPKGEMDEDRLRALIAAQGLKAEVRKLERDHLRDLVVRNRGDLRSVAKGLHLPRAALVTKLREFGLWEGAETLRSRIRREIHERSMEGRMQLILKSAAYLGELGTLEAVTQGLSRDLLGRFPNLRELDSAGRQGRLAQGLRITPALAGQLLEKLSLEPETP